ncbi:hypothetical protein FAP39_11560 [Shimia litoralis]|uniref:Uncharacterized protein n=1 Tax=Shimia litoralis TaxID=420403 RepID=A0A4U7N2H7_9RHOB|nr:hypothetical protein [Shimia litoralis]TKZ19376.1 hypothetical protein FAP39_11560 [Shimia litoralis]
MTGRNVLRLLLALTILVSGLLRPPGTMLVFDGDSITYEICNGGELETITIPLDGEPQRAIDLGCDFFATQIAALPFPSPEVIVNRVELTRLPHPVASRFLVETMEWRAYAPRAPPLVS